MITIQNYDKDLNQAVFYGWDIISADETHDAYLFQLRHRQNNKLRVYITLGRETQLAPTYFIPMHQMYIHDDDGDWDYTGWFEPHDITHKNFWDVVEEVVDKNYPNLLPF